MRCVYPGVCARLGVPRGWDMSHMRKCTVCKEYAPGFAAVAESKRFSVPSHKLHFTFFHKMPCLTFHSNVILRTKLTLVFDVSPPADDRLLLFVICIIVVKDDSACPFEKGFNPGDDNHTIGL